ncbi:endonuclease V [Candidatus Woesearchaeota archaeon]|nr:endonuclease V [Candidatus Woesearchaeota archaeon]
MLGLSKFKEEQLKLANEVTLKCGFSKVKTIGGCDQAFIDEDVISGIVICNKDIEITEKKHAVVKTKIPYVPGFLFYREGPAIIDVFNKLEKKPDVLLVDGNGILHPRRIGMASQLGIILDIPTVGITKNLMCGSVKEGKVYVDKEIRGFELKTREHARPIYVSPGHKVSLGTCLEIAKSYLKPPHKLPEPLHLAHKYVNQVRKELTNKK